jgi:hypothetical protein
MDRAIATPLPTLDNIGKRHKSKLHTGFEPNGSVLERKTTLYALDHAATLTGTAVVNGNGKHAYYGLQYMRSVKLSTLFYLERIAFTVLCKTMAVDCILPTLIQHYCKQIPISDTSDKKTCLTDV